MPRFRERLAKSRVRSRILRRAAASKFLFDPEHDVGGNVLNDDPRLNTAEELHRLPVDESHMRHIEHDLRGSIRVQRGFQFRNVFARELAPQMDSETGRLTSSCRNL